MITANNFIPCKVCKVKWDKHDLVEKQGVSGEFITIYPSDVLMVEGILVFYFPRICDKFNLKLFVDTDADNSFKLQSAKCYRTVSNVTYLIC